MSRSNVSLQDVLDRLGAENLLPDATADRAATVIGNMSAVQPWYVRTMVGFGAWLASLLLIGFVAGIGFAAKGGFTVIGLGMIVAAVMLRKRFDTDFVVQSTLAVSLAGQALLAFGVSEFKASSDFEVVLLVVVIMSTVLFVIFPDRIHRVLMVLFVTSALTILMYIWELNAIVPFLGPAWASALVLLYKRQSQFLASGQGALVRPLMTGLMLSAFGCLLVSTIYVLPELGVDYAFYPRPWISSLLLGALFIYLGTDIWPQLLTGTPRLAAPVIYGLMGVVIAAAWAVPGLLLAMVVVMLGAASGNRVLIGAGVTFLAVFLATYFYGIQITMLTKSVTLVASGTAVLLARWLILKVVAHPAQGEAANV